ncbi:uncharacterized protein LOC119082917 [Bradysia coprophila]|uniref:uncharacterized protein LOC119082917 n=1 Tax=Bradysia coprophila TaxID=38358 RepID=UPI00187DD960|nr:uncharacterized protein LOC119082917 [Bradysia coprophila]
MEIECGGFNKKLTHSPSQINLRHFSVLFPCRPIVTSLGETHFDFFACYVAVNAVLSSNVPARNGFQYIGSFRSRLSVQGRSTQLFDESNYYISQNWGACNTAQKDCKNLLNANLLAVETEEEWKYVREMLKNYGFDIATAYWTSGEYARTDWRWSANDIVLAPCAPWESGHPKKANPLLSVLINYRNRYDATWSTVPNTQLHRYISEVKVQAPFKDPFETPFEASFEETLDAPF